jgi:hypothetical protein
VAEGLIVRTLVSGAVLTAFLFCGCNQNTSSQVTASLLAVDDMSLLCVERTGSPGLGRVFIEYGLPLEACVDGTSSNRAMLALATQPETGEVAVLDASSCAQPSYSPQSPCSVNLVDAETAQPGLNFLPVGAQPVGIVSTPGGTASFVAVAEPGKTGIFGLPTSCIGTRERGSEDDAKAVRDLRTWPACRLPSAPGAILLLRDQQLSRGRCDGKADVVAPEDQECPADLTSEERSGRLKLAVTLPDRGEVWTLDAQSILDHEPGTYELCEAEQVVALRNDRPEELTQAVPADLSSEAKVYTDLGGSWVSTPTDLAGDFDALHGEVYVADRTAPLVHKLDTRDVCAISEGEPLYPVSLKEPNAVIATRKVALSPQIDALGRYVYAIEDSGTTSSSSAMVFDVTPGKTQRTPIVLERSQLVPGHVPDRVDISGPASDVDFVYRDPGAPGENGINTSGVMCDPEPSHDSYPGASFRPKTSTGAGPSQMRGLFAVISDFGGALSIVDVEDYDAPCRRPSDSAKTYGEGCASDPWRGTTLNDDDETRVTDEKSCHVFQPHRVRSRNLYTDDVGMPRLRAFPRLRSETGASLLVDRSEQAAGNPRMLATPAPGEVGELTVVSTKYTTDGEDATRLEVDPGVSERNSVLLPTDEPRSYMQHSGLATVTYEGFVGSPVQATLKLVGAGEFERQDANLPANETHVVANVGAGAELCRVGVEDELSMGQRGAGLAATAGGLVADDAAAYALAFGERYADFVELLEPLLSDKHTYWDGVGDSCGEAYRDDGVTGRRACELTFGEKADSQPQRDFRIVRAFDDELVIEPRTFRNSTERQRLLEMAACCFPDAAWIAPRASNQWLYRDATQLQHSIAVGPSGACERSTDKQLSLLNSRAFEVACSGDCDTVGAPYDDEVPVCVLDGQSALSAQPELSACEFKGLTARFAVYRGKQPSRRGMEYSFSVSGGFLPFEIPMNSFADGKYSIPQRLKFVRDVGRLIVTDGGPPSNRDGRPIGFVLLGLETSSGNSGITFSTVNYVFGD